MASHTRKLLSTALLGLLILLSGRPAEADPIFDTSGTFSVTGTNAPDNFTTSGIPVGAASTQVDGTVMTLTQSIIPIGGGKEWIVWDFQTNPINGSRPPIAGNLNADWALAVNNVPLVGTFALVHFYVDWGTNGILVSPTNNIGSNLPLETNPITGVGTVFGQDFNIITTVAGGNGAANTFSGALTQWGFDPSNTNEFQMGELFEPVPAPEPASLTLLGAGLICLAGVARRRRRG